MSVKRSRCRRRRRDLLLAHYFRYIDVVELVVLVVALIVSKTVAVVFSISEEVAVAIIIK